MLTKPELSLILPAYNEEGAIESALGQLDRVVSGMGLQYEIVVVDDGSVDGTRMRATSYASKNGHVRVVGYDENVGKGYALRKGFMNALGDAIILVDSDLEIDFKCVSYYVKALQHADIVIASKWHPESVVKIPFIRRILGHGFNLLVRLMTGLKLSDTQTGLKAIKRKAFETIIPRMAVKRYAFDVELLVVSTLYGLKVAEMPVNIKMKTSFGIIQVWRMFMDLLGITYRLRVSRWYQQALCKKRMFGCIVD